MIDPNQPAFPRVAFDKTGELTTDFPEFNGMTIRTQLAAMAMQGLIHSEFSLDGHVITKAENVAKRAVRCADALIAELNRNV